MIRANAETDDLAIRAKVDQAAFGELADIYRGYFRRSAQWHAHGAEDGMQALLTELWRCVSEYEPSRGHFATFAGTSLRYCFKWENRRLRGAVASPRSAPRTNGQETLSELRDLVREQRPGASDFDVERLVNVLQRRTVAVDAHHATVGAESVYDAIEERARARLMDALREWVVELEPRDALLFERRELAEVPASWRQLERELGVGRNRLSSRHAALVWRWYDWLWAERRELVRDARRMR